MWGLTSKASISGSPRYITTTLPDQNESSSAGTRKMTRGTKTILYEVLSAYMGSALYCTICFLLRLAMSSAADFEEDSFKVLCLVFLHFILIAPIHSIGLHVYFHPPRKGFQATLLLLVLLSIAVLAFAIWPTGMLFYSVYALPALIISLLICRYFQKRRDLPNCCHHSTRTKEQGPSERRSDPSSQTSAGTSV